MHIRQIKIPDDLPPFWRKGHKRAQIRSKYPINHGAPTAAWRQQEQSHRRSGRASALDASCAAATPLLRSPNSDGDPIN